MNDHVDFTSDAHVRTTIHYVIRLHVLVHLSSVDSYQW